MRRRILAACAAIVLASLGAVLLMSYVNGADQRAAARAAAGMASTSVLVALAPIPQGTPVAGLARLVAIKTIPSMAVVAGALSSLGQVSGKVSTIQIEPGEQLLTSRFTDPATLHGPATPGDAVQVPAGMHEVSVLLEPQRVLGGNLAAGARVGVFISAHLALDKVLVTRVQGGIPAPTSPSAGGTTVPPASVTSPSVAAVPGGSVMVTFAVSPLDAQTLLTGAQRGTVWLSLDPAHAE